MAWSCSEIFVRSHHGGGAVVWSELPPEEKTMRIHIRPSVQRHSDLLAILSVVAIMFVVGSGIYYLRESVHVPMQTRIFAGPVSTI
jgi:hypothetical protein